MSEGPVRRVARYTRESKDTHPRPIAADLKRARREKSKIGQKTLALTQTSPRHTDRDCNWYFLGSQVQLGSTVYVNKVGTFGVAYASYCWFRVSSAIGRLAQDLVGHASHTWHMLVADRLSAGHQLSVVPSSADVFFSCALFVVCPYPGTRQQEEMP